MSGEQTEFAALIDRYAKRDGVNPTPIPRLALVRSEMATMPLHGVFEAALCIIAQGSKRALLGDQVLTYDENKFLVISVDVPAIGQIIEASPEKPYLCVVLHLDRETLASLLLDEANGTARPQAPAPALAVSTVTPEFTDAVVRLLKLLAAPEDIPVLAPLAEREILFRLLQGEQGARVREIALADSRLQRINRAIQWIREHYAEPFRIDDLAAMSGMSASALHSHFKAVTTMSPLQYQKELRLREARRLMLIGERDAATASFDVGYSSPSQFSREYRRLFGLPPQRDIERLRELPPGLVAA
ncbi:AraC family transcriptional regulator [Methyloligella sp. 2.7D]|uniref:AraC family transcriptional regulator n=1 Tax=unclassified Methyloligella TaxID=2625955 RepID=UPI00157E2B6F|nr:AraC family transcriptional regulator [Methyloligella sp. GL2]QKP77495.1 AraC family transcriptional regulator [Methyloligella sp. GL2]